MPTFGAMTCHKSCGSYRATDETIINNFTSRLNATTEVGIRRTPNKQVFFGSKRKNLLTFFTSKSERFFTIGVFTCVENGKTNFSVRLWYCEVDDNLDAGVC